MSVTPDAQRLREIIGVASEIAATRLDLESIMNLVARQATALTGADSGAVELAQEGEDSAAARRAAEAGHAALCVPLRHRDETVGLLTVTSAHPDAFDSDDADTLDLLSGIVAAHLTNAEELAAARRQSYEDPLTALPGGRVFERTLRGEVARASRYGLRLSLAVLDVDGLERVNEQHGRSAGDEILCRLATVLRDVRTSDMAFRIDEDEFALLLPNTPYHAARTVAERTAAAVGGCGLPAGRVRVSVGVAEARSADPPGLLVSARASLERAKDRRPGLSAA